METAGGKDQKSKKCSGNIPGTAGLIGTNSLLILTKRAKKLSKIMLNIDLLHWRKFLTDLFFLRSLLDNAFENEAKCKSEAEQARRELIRVQG
jgi:hypothetical protein